MNRTAILSSFFKATLPYYTLEPGTIAAMEKLIRLKEVPAGTHYLQAGEAPVFISYIYQGLFSYYHQFENGDTVIKKFFAENSFMASTSALVLQTGSKYSIEALEKSIVAEFSFREFKHLMHKHQDLAFFWISYLETNWVAGKEDSEITHKYLTAQARYQHFLLTEPHIAPRLQQQQIAAYLGITPTQLSRIKKAIPKK